MQCACELQTMNIFFCVAAVVSGAALTAAVPTRSSGVVCEASKFPYFVEDSSQCDKFVRCQDKTAFDELCEDGFVFDEKIQRCDFPFHVDCSTRSNLQPSKGFGNCSRLNGIFEVANTCDLHFFCRDGQDVLIKCPTGLVFDKKQGVCEFPDIAMKPGCLPEEFLGFRCPARVDDELAFGDHERHAKPGDCRFYFKCMRNGRPRLGGCEFGRVYNPESGSCDEPKNVKGCENYYKNSSVQQ